MFSDPSRPPTGDELRAGLGDSWPRWQELADWVGARYGVSGEPLFSGAVSGWAVRFRRSGRALLTLSPQASGGFRALVVIGPSGWAQVPALPLGPVMRDAWEAAKPYPDGRWLFVPVEDGQTVDDVERLIELKSPPPSRPRRTPPGAVPA